MDERWKWIRSSINASHIRIQWHTFRASIQISWASTNTNVIAVVVVSVVVVDSLTLTTITITSAFPFVFLRSSRLLVCRFRRIFQVFSVYFIIIFFVCSYFLSVTEFSAYRNVSVKAYRRVQYSTMLRCVHHSTHHSV